MDTVSAPTMDPEERQQRERLITVLSKLEDLTERQVSLKYALMRGVVYGLGTVIGATIIISISSYFFVQIFGISPFTNSTPEQPAQTSQQ